MDSRQRINTYRLNIETPRPNTNRHVYAHKCLHYAGIEPATSCVVGAYYHHYATSAVNNNDIDVMMTLLRIDLL
jgi:hypothetical protein